MVMRRGGRGAASIVSGKRARPKGVICQEEEGDARRWRRTSRETTVVGGGRR
jgi:hypothetical protein